MLIFPTLIVSIYSIAQVAAWIAGIALFLVLIIGLGFNSEYTDGSTVIIGIGFNFALSLLLALVSVGPLLVFETMYKTPAFPNPFYLQAFWIVFLVSVLGNTLGTYFFVKQWSLSYALIPLIGLISAAWVTKTIGLVPFVFETFAFGWFLKIIYLGLGLIEVVLYFILPGMTAGAFATIYKKS